MCERVVQARGTSANALGRRARYAAVRECFRSRLRSTANSMKQEREMMQMAMTELNLSARAYDRVLKVRLGVWGT